MPGHERRVRLVDHSVDPIKQSLGRFNNLGAIGFDSHVRLNVAAVRFF